MGRDLWGQEWGAGKYGLDELRERFNLQYSPELEEQASARGGGMYNEAGDIWGRNKAGERVYLGRAQGLYDNPELIQAHSRQAHPDEVFHSVEGDNLSSIGDRAGAIWNVWDAGYDGVEKEPQPQPQPTPTVEEDTRRGMQNVLKYALEQFGADSDYGNWARENYPFFAPYNRSSADPFEGVQYFGPNAPVRNVPEGLPSYMGTSFTDEYEPDYVSSTEVTEAERPEGYMTMSEEERMGGVAALALDSLLKEFGLA